MPHTEKLTSRSLAIPVQLIERRIYLIRGHKVMIDVDLAELYGVTTKRLNQQVQRNRKRFPEDFMFQLTRVEAENLRLQFATSRSSHGGRRSLPYVFTEQGVAMLSSVLNSEEAIEVNITINIKPRSTLGYMLSPRFVRAPLRKHPSPPLSSCFPI